MRRVSWLLLCLLSWSVPQAILRAGPITGTISGTLPGGDAVALPNGGFRLDFGDPVSRVTFTPARGLDTSLGGSFFIGSFRFDNFAMGDANWSGSFQTGLRFNSLESVTRASFTYDLDLTQNAQDLVQTVRIGLNSPDSVRLPDGRSYTLQLEGFTDSPTPGADPRFRDSFSVEFCHRVGEGYLFGSLVPVQTTPQVPEPGSLLLLLTGGAAILGGRFVKRRRIAIPG